MNTRSVDPISSTSAAPEPSVATRPKRRSVFLEEVIKNKGKLKSDRNKPLPKPPKREKPPKTRNEKIFYAIGAILLVLGISALVWQNWGQDYVRSRSKDPNVKPVAKLYNEYITEQQFQDSIDDKLLLSQKLHGGEQDKYAEEQAYDDILLERALEAEAKKRNIIISETDIDAEITKAKVSVAQLNADADKNGVSRDIMRRGWRLAALKTKLATYLLDSRDVRQYFVRWDFAPDPLGTDIVNDATAFAAFQDQAREKLRQLVDAPLRAGVSQEDILKGVNIDIDKYDREVKPLNLVARSINGMNKEADAQFQDGKNDWAAIEGLNKDGQYSDIIRSDGGYYAIYYLKHRNAGQFISWNDFLNSVKKSTKKFTAAAYTTHYAAVQTDNTTCHQNQVSVLSKVLAWVGIGKAEACGSGHLNRFTGVVTDSGGYSVNNLNIQIVPRNPASTNYCTGSTGATYHTDGWGTWDTNRENGAVRYSCFMQWAMIVSNSCGNSQWYPLINPGTNNGTVNNNVVFNGGNCTSKPSIVAIDNIDCATDTITGWAVSPNNPGGNPIYGNIHTSYVGFFFRDKNDSNYPVGNANFQEQKFLLTDYASFHGEFHPPLGSWTLSSAFGNFGTANTNPLFVANVGGSWPLEGTYTTYPHRFSVTGLMANHQALIPERNFQDGRVWSIIPTGLDPSTSTFSSAYGAYAEVDFQCDPDYDLNGDLSTAGAPTVAGTAPNMAGNLVSTNKPFSNTFAGPAPLFSWTLFGFQRTNDYAFDTASPIDNWEKYGWTACFNGDANCHASQVKAEEFPLTIPRSSLLAGKDPHLRYYFRPIPAGPKIRVQLADGTNPCTLPGSDYRRSLCTSALTGSIYGNAAGVTNPASVNGPLNIPGSPSQRNYVFNSGAVAMSGPNNEAQLSNIYPGTYNLSMGGTAPGGFSPTSYQICDSNGNGCSTLNPNFTIPANDNRIIVVGYTLRNVTLFGNKVGPQTFITNVQNGSPGLIGMGTVNVDGTTVSANWATAYWQSSLTYGSHTIDVTAPEGWEVRGYGFCLTTATTSCTASVSDVTATTSAVNQIILNTGSATSMAIPITVDGSGNMQIAGNTVGPTQNLGIVYYFKPAKVSVQARVVIDKWGPDAASNADLNPCSAAIPSGDYKRDLCNVEVRAVRMNTGGLADSYNAAAIDAVGGAIAVSNCTTNSLTNDFVPQRPGYNYPFKNSYYCAGGDISTTPIFDGATPYTQVGKTWDAQSGGVATNTDPAESNLAIFRNLYPGKYRFEYRNAPTYTHPGFANELAYSQQTSYCAPNVADCTTATTPWAVNGNCPGTNWRGTYSRGLGVFDNSLCTNTGGSHDLQPRSTGPICGGSYSGSWPFGNPAGCGQQKVPSSNQDVPGASGDFMVNPYKASNPDKFREATFLFTPKIKAYNPVLSCDKYEADVVYLPAPNRPVTSSLNIWNQDVDNAAGDIQPTTSAPTGNFGAHISIDIPKWLNNSWMIKDGQGRPFVHYVHYDDPDLSPPPGGINNGAWNTYKYHRIPAYTGTHVCTNNALCNQADLNNQAAAFGEMDAGKEYNFTVKMKNNGRSFWQNTYQEAMANGTSRTNTTTHLLAIAAQNGASSGYLTTTTNAATLGSVATNSLQLPIPGGATGAQSDPDSPDEVTFNVRITTPTDGASNYRLEIGMEGNGWNGSSNPKQYFPAAAPPAPGKCVVNFEVRNDYHPWLRVQNGGVGALGQVQNQHELDRGTYKALNPTGTSPLYGVQTQNPGVADINSFAQYTVISASSPNYFCSSNGYLFGRDTTTAYTAKFYEGKTCSFGVSEYNLDSAVKADLTPPGTGDLIYKSAVDSFNNKSSCKDTGQVAELGPEDSANPSAFYRKYDDPAITDLSGFDKIPGAPTIISLVRTNKTTAGTPIMDRPCPTIRNWGSATLPALQIGRGRGTLLRSGDLTITGDIANVINDAYLGITPTTKIEVKKPGEVYDIGQLNRLPNLGIIVDGDVYISKDVARIDASIYASGQIYTCDAYPGTLATPGTTGPKPSYKDALTPNTVFKAPMLADNPDAAKCSKQLKVTGTLASAKSFSLGRNYLDFAGIVNRFNNVHTGIFTSTVPALGGKFCSSFASDPTYSPQPPRCGGARYSGLSNAPDFDNLNSPDPYNANKNFLVRQGYPQSLYYGGAAEDVLYNGLMLVAPPPGFENVSDNALNRARFDSRAFPPLF